MDDTTKFLIGQSLILLVFFLTIRNNDRRERRGRVLQMKREVYLQVLDDMAKMGKWIQSLGTRKDFTNSSASEIAPSIAKLELVASEEVLKAFLNIQAHQIECIKPLISGKMELMKIEAEYQSATNLHSNACTDSSDYYKAVGNHKRERNIDIEKHLEQVISERFAEIEAQAPTLLKKQMEFAGKCTSAAAKHQGQALPLVLAMRKDLESGKLNKTHLTKILEKSNEEQAMIYQEIAAEMAAAFKSITK